MNIAELITPPDYEVRANAFMATVSAEIKDSYPDIDCDIINMIDHPLYKTIQRPEFPANILGISKEELEKNLQQMEAESCFRTMISVLVMSPNQDEVDAALRIVQKHMIRFSGLPKNEHPIILQVPLDPEKPEIKSVLGQMYVIFSD